MKTGFVTIAVWVLGSLACATADAQFGGFFGGGPKIETIGTNELNEMLTNEQKRITDAQQAGEQIPDPSFVLVDVRSEKEIDVSIIPGAITKTQYKKDAAKYQDKLVIPYCTVGGRSGAYAKQLAKGGVKVKNYQGSILKWVDAGLPLVTLDGQSTNRVHTYSDRYQIPAKYEQVTQ